MAVTQAAIRTAVRLALYSAAVTEHPYVDQANGAVLDSDTTITVDNGTAWAAGNQGEFQDDGDKFRVVSVSGNDLTVIRESGASAHADNVEIYQDPKFSIAQIDDATTAILDDLRNSLWLVYQKTLTYDSTTMWYPFSAAGDDDIYDVRSVYFLPSGQDHPAPIEFWRFQQETASAEFTAERGLIISAGLNVPDSGSVYVICRKRIDDITALPDEFKYIVVNGICYMLLGAADVRRLQDPGKRTDRTVQPGSEQRASIWFLREYIRRRDRAEADLIEQEAHYPQSRVANRARRYRA